MKKILCSIVLMLFLGIFIYGNHCIAEEFFKEEEWLQKVEELNQAVRENNEEILNRLNKEINYIGKVVDQNNNPVSGVEITGLIETLVSLVDKERHSLEPVFTDANGLFNITGEGSLISLVIRKEGYYSTNISYNTDNAYRVINEVFSDIRTTNMFSVEMVAVLDKNIIPEGVDEIVLIEKGQLYGLRGACIDVDVPKNEEIGVNLYRETAITEGEIIIPIQYIDDYADILIELKDNGSTDPNDWQIVIKFVNEGGGLIEFHPVEYANYTDYIMRDAPETGYTQECTINLGDLEYNGPIPKVHKNYYFKYEPRDVDKNKLNISQFYFGKITDMDVHIYKNRININFTYAFNPDGTVHLEN